MRVKVIDNRGRLGDFRCRRRHADDALRGLRGFAFGFLSTIHQPKTRKGAQPRMMEYLRLSN